jgi:hypothetical protein
MKHRKFLPLIILGGLIFIITGIYFLSGFTANGTLPKPNKRNSINTENLIRNDSCIHLLHNGDLVLRTGNDDISNVFRHLNAHNQTYSHAGIVMIEQGYPFVYHSIGGADNPNERLRRDSLPIFISPKHNLGWAIVRYNFDTVQLLALHRIVANFYIQKIKFDNDFDLNSNDKFYCSEFVYKSINKAVADTNYIPLSIHNGKRFVGVDNLFENKHVQTICELRYK